MVRVLSLEERKEMLKEALERHRLYLLAKNDFQLFRQRVGFDKADALWKELKKSSKSDTKVANNFLKVERSNDNSPEVSVIRSVCTREDWYDYWRSINEDAQMYLSGPSGRGALRRMKLHQIWAFLSYLLMLVVAIFLGLMPWLDGLNLAGINLTTIAKISFIYICSFMFFIWFVWNIADLKIGRWKIELPVYGKKRILFLATPFLIYVVMKYAETIKFNVIEDELYRSIAVSVIAVSYILLILDCMASLGCRKYYIGLDGIKRKCFTATWYLDSYKKESCYDDIYRKVEREKLGELGEVDQFRHFQFQPSASLRYIAAYIFVDIIHSACIVLWMVILISSLSHLSVIHNVIVSSISFAVMCTLLNTPSTFYFCNTNRLNRYICKNLFAYKVSHLFRKLFYSLVLLGACILIAVFA